VLGGLIKAFDDYEKKNEAAWRKYRAYTQQGAAALDRHRPGDLLRSRAFALGSRACRLRVVA
jgi:hypothetical protein